MAPPLKPGQHQDLLKAFEKAGFKAMLAGGCVRDRLLGLLPKDFDIATTALPAEVTAIVRKEGWKSIPTGLEHGTITIVTFDGSFECTTLRKDVTTFGRHAQVVFDGATFEDDALRRDFTINALFEDLGGVVHDYVGGQKDIEQRVLRFVGEPQSRIREDYLRILRFYRFWARLGFTPDETSRRAARGELDGLRHVSMERVSAEMWGILCGDYAMTALEAMYEDGVLASVTCEGVSLTFEKGLAKGLAFETPSARTALQPWVLLTSMMGITNKNTGQETEAAKFAKHWKWSDENLRRLQALFEGWSLLTLKFKKTSDKMLFIDQMVQASRRQDFLTFFVPVWRQLAKLNADKAREKVVQELEDIETQKFAIRTAVLPVTGDDVLEYRPDFKGKDIGAAKDHLTKEFRDGVWHTKDEGLKKLKTLKIDAKI